MASDSRKLQILLNKLKGQERVAGARIIASIDCLYDYTRRNSYKTHPLQKRYAENEHKIHLHAEIAAIASYDPYASANYSFEHRTLYVARLCETGAAMACPCDGCMNAIMAFKIGRLVYTQSPTSFMEIDLIKNTTKSYPFNL